MENDTTFASDFSLNKLILIPMTGEKDKIELRYLMVELNIYEDLFNNTTYGDIVLSDSINLIKNIPIFGYETLEVDFNSPNRDKPFSKKFRIYKITNKKNTKERQQVYILHFVSDIIVKDQKTIVDKSYKGKLISDIANDIQTKYLDSKFAVLEPTKYPQHIIIPRWHPARAINWLASRANSAQYEGSNYIYFENQKGFNFCSISKLIDVPSSVVTYVYQPANLRIPYDKNSSTKLRDIEKEIVGIQSFEFKEPIDLLRNIELGMFGSSLITHSLIRKKYFKYGFNYKDTWTKFKHLEEATKTSPDNKFKGLTFFSNQNGLDISTESVHRLYPSENNQSFPNKVDEWLLQNISQIEQIHGLKMNLSVPGDSQRTVGDVVSVYLPSPEALGEDEQQELEKYYQGRYLVSSLRHTIGKHAYTNTMELLKDSVATPYP